MKKIVFGAIILFAGLGFSLQFVPVATAETSPINTMISQEEAAVLQVSLDALKNSLLELQKKADRVPQVTIVKLENIDITALERGLDTLSGILTEMQAQLRETKELKIDKTALNANLDGITENLVILSSGLKNLSPESFTIANKPAQIIAENKLPIPEKNIIATKEQRDEILTAQLSDNSKKLPTTTIIGIISILILSAATFLYLKEKPKNKKTEITDRKKELAPQMQNSAVIYPPQRVHPPQPTRVPQEIKTPQQPQTESYFIKSEDKRKPA
ncbi:MAG: hypothetical protein QMD65_03095 [Patescibacteria group bacterium]|nr:hypothetical protein [Patescibacteria group bacterium]